MLIGLHDDSAAFANRAGLLKDIFGISSTWLIKGPGGLLLIRSRLACPSLPRCLICTLLRPCTLGLDAHFLIVGVDLHDFDAFVILSRRGAPASTDLDEVGVFESLLVRLSLVLETRLDILGPSAESASLVSRRRSYTAQTLTLPCLSIRYEVS